MDANFLRQRPGQEIPDNFCEESRRRKRQKDGFSNKIHSS